MCNGKTENFSLLGLDENQKVQSLSLSSSSFLFFLCLVFLARVVRERLVVGWNEKRVFFFFFAFILSRRV